MTSISLPTLDDALDWFAPLSDPVPLLPVLPSWSFSEGRRGAVERRTATLQREAPVIDKGRFKAGKPRFCECGSALSLLGTPSERPNMDSYSRTDDNSFIPVMRGTGDPRFKGLKRCKNMWLCLACAPQESLKLAGQLARVCSLWTAKFGAGTILFLTPTIPHKSYHGLGQLLGVLQGAWSNVWGSGRKVSRWRKVYGLSSFVRAFDLTHSERNGWHPHIHSLLFFERPLRPGEASALRGEMFNEFRKHVLKLGLEAPLYERFTLEYPRSQEGLTKYLAKCSGMGMSEGHRMRLSVEVAGSGVKRRDHHKHGARTLREILEDTADFLGERDLALFAELCQALYHKRLWDRGRRAEFKAIWVQAEEELKAEEGLERGKEEELDREVLRVPLWAYSMARACAWSHCILAICGSESGSSSLQHWLDDTWAGLPIERAGYWLGNGSFSDDDWEGERRTAPELKHRRGLVRDWLTVGYDAVGLPLPSCLADQVASTIVPF